MSELSDWLFEHPELTLPWSGPQAQSGAGTPGTQAPAPGAAEVGGESNTPLIVGAVLVLLVVLIIVAWRSFRGAPSEDGGAEAPTREPSGKTPERDILKNRQVVKEVSEITEDDSLKEVKTKKMEKVEVSSYEEAKKLLEARKAGKVKQAQRERIASQSVDEEALSADSEAPSEDAEAPSEAKVEAAPEEKAEEAPEAKAEAPAQEEAQDAAEAKVEEAPEEKADEEPAEAPKAQEEPAPEKVEAEAEAKSDEKVEVDPLAPLDLGADLDSGWGDINFDALDFSSPGELNLDLAEPLNLGGADDEAEAAEAAPEASAAQDEPAQASAEAKDEPAQASAQEEPAEAPEAQEEAAPEAKADEAAAEAPVAQEEAAPEKVEAAPVKVEEKVEAEPAAAPVEDKPVEAPKAERQKKQLPEEMVGVRSAQEGSRSLADGLRKTRGGFVARLGQLFNRQSAVDGNLIDEMEEVLYTADVGPRSVELLLSRVRSLGEDEARSASTVWGFVREETERLLTENEVPLDLQRRDGKPFVMLVVGVNGVGKTTTIGKLAMRYTEAGHKVLLVAGDTFRAAATEQLEEWGERTGMAVHTGGDGADPASVVYGGIERGINEDFDIVICDTAGRLTNKKNLMKELEKIGRVAGKALDGAPHETLLVLDANTGLQALQQARMFQEVVDITGIALTKLDGTAKGGMIVAISQELEVPVRYIGIGEGVYDLRPFDAREFVEALFM